MRAVLFVVGVLCLVAGTAGPSAAAIGQILRVESDVVVVGYQASPDLLPGARLTVRKLFRDTRVSAPASVVSVDRVLSIVRVRFEGPAKREGISLQDYVEMVVVPVAVPARKR